MILLIWGSNLPAINLLHTFLNCVIKRFFSGIKNWCVFKSDRYFCGCSIVVSLHNQTRIEASICKLLWLTLQKPSSVNFCPLVHRLFLFVITALVSMAYQRF